MRFRRGVAYKEGQWEQLADLQIDTATLRRWIQKEEHNKEACKGEGNNNSRLLKQIEGRWEVGTTDKADAEKKHLLEFEERASIDRVIGEEGRTKQALGEHEKE